MNYHQQQDTMFEQMCSYESLLSAYQRARCAGRYKSEVLLFGAKLEANLILLRNDLLSGKYTHGVYREFIINDSKKRNIKAATFRDRIVHNALHHMIEPLFDRTFIADSYACRKNKGTHKALSRVSKWIHKKQYTYVLSCDIASYFASIDYTILMKIISRKIKDTKVQELCRIILKSGSDIDKGIPIGNLTSQLFANIYLDVLDRYIKQRYDYIGYIRYMDDFLIFGNNKEELHNIKIAVKTFLEKELMLHLHPKKALISPIKIGVPFIGYIIFETYTTLRKSTVHRFIKRVKIFKDNQNNITLSDEERLNSKKKFKEGVRSWFVYASHSSSYELILSLDKDNNFLEHIKEDKLESNKECCYIK